MFKEVFRYYSILVDAEFGPIFNNNAENLLHEMCCEFGLLDVFKCPMYLFDFFPAFPIANPDEIDSFLSLSLRECGQSAISSISLLSCQPHLSLVETLDSQSIS